MQTVPKICSLIALIGSTALGPQHAVQAEEPYERFLQELRDEQLYDVALDYLTSLEGRRGLAPEFVADLELERGMLLFQSAAMLAPSNPLRDSKLDEAEKSLRDFLATKKQHPRRGEARLKVGELLLQRAEEAKTNSSTDTKQDKPEAIQFYDEAHKLFEETVSELAGILDQIKGARTDPNDKRKVAYRRKIQGDIRQAQLLSAKSVEERGRSRADGSAAQKKDLELALKMLSDLYSKERSMVGIRNYALFYRSAIQKTLGKTPDAIDGFQRIADLEGVDVLRTLQTKAVTELVELLADEKKYPVAVERAEKWVASFRPDERKSFEANQLQLRLAKTKLTWADSLKKQEPDSRVAARMIRDTRSSLRSLLRNPGSHIEETRELLAELGVAEDEEQSDELPEVKEFGEALVEAQKRIDRAEDSSLPEAATDLALAQAVALLREAIRLHSPTDDMEKLDQAYYSLAYALQKQQELYESLAVAEMLAYRNPRTDKGLNSAGLALKAISYILQTAGDEERVALTNHLEPFAKYLVETWPASLEASAAASALVQLALNNKQWEKVDSFLALVPASGDSAKKVRIDAGLSFYVRYTDERKKVGGDTEETARLRKMAMESLAMGIAGLKQKDLDSSSIQAITTQARLLLADDKLDEAVKLLFKNDASPIKALEAKPDATPARVAMNTYRTAIQLAISQLADGKLDTQAATKQTTDYIAKLQGLATDDASREMLSGIFIALAQDLKDQLTEVSDPQKRKRMSEALVIVAKEAAKAEDFGTQYWAADTIFSVAGELANQKDGAALAQQFYGQAASILTGILSKNESSPGWIQPAARMTQIRLQSAICNRGLGDFKTALNLLADILAEKNYLDVQIEAAKTYQAWGDATNPLFHKAAYLGGRRNAQGVNLFWGFGKIARSIDGNPELEEEFYSARYNLALSRFKHARGTQDAEARTQLMKSAEKDITATAARYPQLGSPEQKKKFDALLKTIQKELGKPTQGLAAIKTISPTNQ